MPKRILVIEDEAAQLLLLESRLTTAGFEVVVAINGEEGLKKALEIKPDLILLDVILPGLSGIDICLRLQEAWGTQEIPAILVTASGMKDLEQRARRFGVQSVLVKPYRFDDLLEKINAFFQSDSIRIPPANPTA